MSPQVDTSVSIGIKRSVYASITSFLCGSAGSSPIFIPKCCHGFGLTSDFSMQLPNHRPCQKSRIMNSPESSGKIVTSLQICMFTCSKYSRRKRYTVHSSNVNDIGRMFLPKQLVSTWLYISVAGYLQITLS